jgi:HAD superfamily hydrolase (TIGR01549 family)
MWPGGFVAFIDYPKYGYKTYRSYLKRILWRLDVRVDQETLEGLARMFKRGRYELYPDAADAVKTAKEHGFKTAIVTTIARFKFAEALRSIENHFDVVVTGYEAGCEKTNPKMYKKTLEFLEVNPNEAVMIGDNLKIDVLLPKKLGIHTILLNRSGTTEESHHADAVAADLRQAVEIVATWSKGSQAKS